MSATAEHFASIDIQLANARASWQEDRKVLERQILELETQLRLTEEAMVRACSARDLAVRTSLKLLTQFGIVATVFDEAKEVAIAAGLYHETSNGEAPSQEALATLAAVEAAPVEAAKAKIDAANGKTGK